MSTNIYKIQEKTILSSEIPPFLRILALLLIILGILASGQAADINPIIVILLILGNIFGTFFGYKLLKNYKVIVQILLAIGIILLCANCFYEIILLQINYISDLRKPILQLLLGLQTLHTFEPQKRGSLLLTAWSSMIMLAFAASLSHENIFSIFLILFVPIALLMIVINELSCRGLALNSNLYKEIFNKSICISYIKVLVCMFILTILIFCMLPRIEGQFLKDFRLSFRIELPENIRRSIINSAYNSKERLKSLTVNPEAYYGFSSELFLNFRGTLSDDLAIKVRSPMPQYWRGMSYDFYTGSTWKLSNPNETTDLQPYPPPTFYIPDSFPDVSSNKQLTQVYYISKNQTNIIFAAYKPFKVYFPVNLVMIDEYGSLRSPVEMVQGVTYTVISRVNDIKPQEIMEKPQEDVDYRYNRDKKLADTISIYLQLPETVTDRTESLARKITRNAKNDYERATLITHFLQQFYTYDLKVDKFPEQADTADYFLFDIKKGYCEHFATTMAVMSRTLGIPSRIVTGYSTGILNPFTGYYEVKVSDAHAWVEIYLRNYGWIAFDPTSNNMEILNNSTQYDNYLENTFNYLNKTLHGEKLIESVEIVFNKIIELMGTVFLYLQKIPYLGDIFSHSLARMVVIIVAALLGIYLVVRMLIKERKWKSGNDYILIYKQLSTYGFNKSPWETQKEFLKSIRAKIEGGESGKDFSKLRDNFSELEQLTEEYLKHRYSNDVKLPDRVKEEIKSFLKKIK